MSELMTIGEFSRLSRLSVRMLRHYDAHGVLSPADVDRFSGYRRYAGSQLAAAVAIRRLRDVGFGIAAIAALLAARGTEAYTEALVLHRTELSADLDAARQRLTLIDSMIKQENTMSITVSRTTIPARTLVTLRGVVPTYSDEGQLWGQFMPLLAAQGIQGTGPGGVIEHDEEYREADVDESVWLEVARGTSAEAPLEIVELPEQDVVMATLVGPYGQISEAHARIGEFLEAEGLRAASGGIEAKVFNRYLTDPSQTAPDANVTEICLPIHPA
ncbi:MerR family transcriptional regulator [Ammonicoccus fulvus]|uniref:MerR family transcriptional regulator n=1 Tax=Ammonicoccus fulvus TaxID=3138240 RepID=A0ABZ3FRW4_9ACTN